MTDNEQSFGSGAASSGDPMRDMLLGFATTIDQLAALVAGTAPTGAAAGAVPGLVGELGTMLTELGDLLARILSAFIAILQALAEMLRSAPTPQAGPSAGPFQTIPVRISTAGA